MHAKSSITGTFVLAFALLFSVLQSALSADLWRIGKEDGVRTEFTSGETTAPPTAYTIPSDWATRTTWPEWQGLSLGQWNVPMTFNPTITYNLGAVPANGAEFSIKTINASQHIPELAVYSNGYLCGIIQMFGTRWFSQGYIDRNVTFGDLYRVYIPKEFLQAGTNTLRLQKLEHPYTAASSTITTGTNCPYLSFEYDYMKLASLDGPATEPINGRYVNLGAQSQADNGQFSVNANDVANRPKALKWLGLAYSGNIDRAYFWRNLTSSQPNRMDFLQMLKSMNMQVLMDYYGNCDDSYVVNGQLIQSSKNDISAFFNTYGGLFQYYEMTNEPSMPFSNESFAAQKAIADYINTIKPGHIKIGAPGYAFGGHAGIPVDWDMVDANRRDLETRCQATGAHAYGGAYIARDYAATGETIDTYNVNLPNGFTNGFPKEYVTSEFGCLDGMDWTFGDQGLTENYSQTFDRIVRAHIAFGSKCNLYAGNDSNGGYQLFDGPIGNSDSWQYHLDPNANGQTARMKIFRQYVLAYATHGKPLTYTYLNGASVQNKLLYFRPVDTSGIGPLPGSGATSNKILLNFVNFDKVAGTMQVRVTLPTPGVYGGERFGSESSYNSARTTISNLQANPTLDFSVNLGPRESVQYILERTGPLPDPVAAGRIGWWRLDESNGTVATDSSGNNFHGTTTGVTWNPASGKIGGSASFSGSVARIQLPDSLLNSIGSALSFTCWFKSSSTGDLLGANDKYYPNTPTNWCAAMYIGTNGKLLGKIWDGTGSYIMSTQNVNDGVWHHVALTASGPNQSLYLDGSLVGSITGNNFSLAPNFANQLGLAYGPGQWASVAGWMSYGGQMDDVRLYNRVLTPVEISTLAAG